MHDETLYYNKSSLLSEKIANIPQLDSQSRLKLNTKYATNNIILMVYDIIDC